MLEKLDRSKLAAIGLHLASILFVSVTIFSNATFKGKQLDLTEGNLFTLTDATRKVLQSIDEPIMVRLFFSKILGEQSPQHATYFSRVRELLGQYENIAGGRLVLSQPFFRC